MLCYHAALAAAALLTAVMASELVVVLVVTVARRLATVTRGLMAAVVARTDSQVELGRAQRSVR